MSHPSFRKTTALVASLSLLVPQSAFVLPAVAQEASLFCLDASVPPCPEGEAVDGTLDAAGAEAVIAARDLEAAAAAAAEAEVEAARVAAEAEAAQAAADLQAQADEAAAAEAQAAAAAAAEVEAARVAAEAEAAQSAADLKAQEDAAAAQAAAQAEADAQAAAEAQALAEAQAQAEAQAAAEAALAEQQAQVNNQTTETATQDATTAEEAASTEAATAAEVEAQAQADLAAAIAAERAAEAEAAEQETATETSEQSTTDQTTTEEAVSSDATIEPTEGDATQADPALALIDPTVSTEEEAPAAAAAAETTDTAAATVEVVEEVVSEETTRSSNEDFATAADGKVRTEARRDEGMSNFEKVLLLGLGAVVVGAVLKNGDQVVTNSGDRVVVETPRGFTVYKDDDALLRQAGSNVRTETFNDGSTRTILDRNDGTQVITIRDSRGRVLRRARVFADGTQVELFDDISPVPAVDVRRLESIRPTTRNISVADANRAALRDALYDELAFDAGRSFSLRQIREIEQVRSLMPAIDLDLITFESGSAAIPTDQVRSLVRVGLLMEEILSENPREVFLIEGHTDATGSASFNLVLSDRRAESVALALTENFRIPPENLVVQGYGEEFLKINTQLSEGRNRRATVRRITPLLRQVASN
jgi:flagellar motor protein MotB